MVSKEEQKYAGDLGGCDWGDIEIEVCLNGGTNEEWQAVERDHIPQWVFEDLVDGWTNVTWVTEEEFNRIGGIMAVDHSRGRRIEQSNQCFHGCAHTISLRDMEM